MCYSAAPLGTNWWVREGLLGAPCGAALSFVFPKISEVCSTRSEFPELEQTNTCHIYILYMYHMYIYIYIYMYHIYIYIYIQNAYHSFFSVTFVKQIGGKIAQEGPNRLAAAAVQRGPTDRFDLCWGWKNP